MQLLLGTKGKRSDRGDVDVLPDMNLNVLDLYDYVKFVDMEVGLGDFSGADTRFVCQSAGDWSVPSF